MLEFRLKAYEQWKKMEEPDWAHVDYPPIDYQDISYYSAPKEKPEIALAVFVENGYWGARWAAPIASLIIEKYLKKEVERKWLEKKIVEGSLISEYEKPFLGKPFNINE